MQDFGKILIQFITASIIIMICICVQTLANIRLLCWVFRNLKVMENKFNLIWRVSIVVRVIFFFVVIHVVQATIWAASYLLLGCFTDLNEALFYSLAVFSASDAGESTLPRSWRLLGPFEGLSGIIAFGLSIGFIFTVIIRLLESRVK